MKYQKLSAKEIAKLTKVPEPIVRIWEKLFPHRHVNDKLDRVEHIELIRELREEGFNQAEIVRALGYDPETVDWYFRLAEKKWQEVQTLKHFSRFKRDKPATAYEPPPTSLVSQLAFPVYTDQYIELQLASGDKLLIDEDDHTHVSQYSWYVQKRKEVSNLSVVSEDAPTRYLTQYIMQYHFGSLVQSADLIKSFMVLHLNHDNLDFRKSNLHVCNQQTLMFHRRPKKGSNSKYKGVRKQNGRYSASITIDQMRTFLGYFDAETQAAQAYDLAATELYGKFAFLNSSLGFS